jgi:hemolysin activation/secretion protein
MADPGAEDADSGSCRSGRGLPVRRSPGGCRPATALALGSAGILAISSGAIAQPVNPPATQAPPQPIAAPPEPSPFSAADPGPAATAGVAAAPGVAIRRVRVLAAPGGSDAVPPEGWLPPTGSDGSFGLHHRPGQPLDAQWVQSQLDRATADGPLPPSSVIGLIQLINRAFITAGFINSGVLVDRQSGDGTLDVRLVYGTLASSDPQVSAVSVEWGAGGSSGLRAGYVSDRFPSLRGQPLSALELERDFRLLDESPAIRSISAALRPGAGPGEASIRLIVHPAQRFDFYTGASNDRSPSVGGDHLFAGGLARNLIGSGDLLTAELGMTRGVEDAQFAYSTPLFTPRVSLNFRGSFNNAAVITSALAPLDIRARDRSAEIGLSYALRQEPLMMRGASRRWSSSQSLTAGVALLHRQQKSFLLGEPFSFAPGSVNGRSEFEAVRFSGDYVRRNLNRVVALSLGSTIGLGGTRSDVPGIPNPDRHFVALLGQFNIAQRLGRGFELRGRLTGQHSRGILYSGLRLAIGGANSVRGYRESLFLVDRGVIGTAELAHSFSLSGERRSTGFDWGSFTASLFADGARFRNAGPPQPEVRSIASVGASLAWTPSSALSATIAYGHGLRDVPTPGSRSLQDRGIHFRVMVHPFGLF